jgi:NADPH:quinone reductase-like Zn-dependent oxidoreductase/acyl carrier protein
VVPKPPDVGFAEAAGLPTAYITAYYALHDLAGIKAGDRVLIHAAAGGVGQAAVALAKRAGAEIFATASPGKHEFLRAQGIRHVMNSRTLDFAERTMELTGGAGVDIVLNSLNNDYIPAGLGVLAPGGRFVELGKIGVWSPERVRRERPDVGYFNFDLSELPERDMLRINQRILRTVTGLVADGQLTPVSTTAYSLDEIEEAFGVLSRGANVGKLVIDMRERDVLGTAPGPALSADETYLVTGGSGALGAVTARKLADEGARHLAIVSRRPAGADEAAALRARLGDVEVVFHRGDIADPADVARIMAEIAASGHPLGGIVHAAGVLADGPVSAMTWEQIDRVFQAKVYGTWLLHEAASLCPGLRFFAGYSSISSVVGPAGQANYAAGNAFIDALLGWRAARGEPGLSIGWGPWAEIGMAASLDARMIKGIEGQGMRFLKPRAGARALWQVLGQPAGHVVVGEVDWDRFVAQRPAGNALYRQVARGGRAQLDAVDLDALIALPRAPRQEAINEAVRARVAALLHFDDAGDVPPHARFSQLGVDSLTAVEIKNALESAFRISLPTSVVLDYPAITQLAEFIDEQLAGPRAGHPAEQEVESLLASSAADIDAELAALRSL